MKINGFNEVQLSHVYAYLVAYEDSGIEKYNSNKALFKDHPELSGLEKLMNEIQCHKANALEMKGVDIKLLKNEIYFTKNKKNYLLSFLSHLRNSIAHGGAVNHNGYILITDFANPKYNPIDFTARGSVELEKVNNFTSLLKNIIL